MSVVQAFLLGLLQGLTEFLPVSSSGHLAIGKRLLGLNENIVNSPTFEIVVHIATALSILVVFRREIGTMLGSTLRFRWNAQTQYLAKIVVAMLPVAIVGLFFKDKVESLFAAGLLLVGAMLLLTALLLTLTHFYRSKNPHPITFFDALLIGIAQAIAVLPGLSRSGTTIAAALLRGNARSDAARFSFLIVLVPILGEAMLGILKGEFSTASTGIGVVPLLTGFLTAFVVGTAACKFMVEFVKRSSLLWFAAYCAAAGIVAILLNM